VSFFFRVFITHFGRYKETLGDNVLGRGGNIVVLNAP